MWQMATGLDNAALQNIINIITLGQHDSTRDNNNLMINLQFTDIYVYC